MLTIGHTSVKINHVCFAVGVKRKLAFRTMFLFLVLAIFCALNYRWSFAIIEMHHGGK